MPSLMYLSLSSTTITEPLSAFFMIICLLCLSLCSARRFDWDRLECGLGLIHAVCEMYLSMSALFVVLKLCIF